ncbi:Transcriptional regulator PA2737, MerR family [hydrothermal vent metagenome]|uniref:Transcriptional regulator PA2737, MerR family n=1 Tax=hydrothermal vent metagenome TaxID=652676 RepID=A0A3B1CCL0_9ZZZZ
MDKEKTGETMGLPGVKIPEKMFYKIRDVARIVDVKAHVLRYWESEFSTLSPRKNRSGQRTYTRKDIDIALEIKRLLHQERFSIAGAKQYLKKKKGARFDKDIITSTRKDLAELFEMLEGDV